MFDEDYYRKLVIKSSNQTQRIINTEKPWYPTIKQKCMKSIDEYKFFVLPPNKMVSLLKKNKIDVPSDDKIREFLKNHSLRNIVDYGEKLKSQRDVRVHPPSVIVQQIRKRTQTRQLYQMKSNKFIQPLSSRTITEQTKQTNSQQKISFKINNQSKSEYINKNMYHLMRQLNDSPNKICENYVPKNFKKEKSIMSQKKIIQYEVPNSILPNPKRDKHQLRQCLLKNLYKIKKMDLSIQQAIELKIFSKKPFEKIGSREFINFAKKNNLEEIQNCLSINPYLVFDFDFYNMTALHWACKKGYYDLAQLLLKYHSDVDGIDILNRTPLYLAIQENNLDIVSLLIEYDANPWSTQLTDLKTLLESNDKAKSILTRPRRLQVMSKWINQSKQK